MPFPKLKLPLSTENLNKFNDLKFEMIDMFKFHADKHDVKWIVDFGALLHIIRDGDMPDYDPDVDISVLPETLTPGFLSDLFNDTRMLYSTNKLEELVTAVDPMQSNDWMPYVYRILTKKSKAAGSYKFMGRQEILNDVFFVFPYKEFRFISVKEDQMLIPRKFYETKYDELTYKGKKYPTPADPEGHLEWVYGPTWRTPDPRFVRKLYVQNPEKYYMPKEDAQHVTRGYFFNVRTGEYKFDRSNEPRQYRGEGFTRVTKSKINKLISSSKALY